MPRWRWTFYSNLQVLSLVMLGIYVRAGNITVDDANSDLAYSTGWMIGQTCPTCTLHPDPNFIYGRTWHDATRGGYEPVTVNYTFEGTDLYVYGILSNVVSEFITSNVNLVLNIDNVDVAAFAFQPLNLNSHSYNANVFAVHDLPDVKHRMSIALQLRSQFHFDYLIYTTGGGNETPTAIPNSSGWSIPVIVGAAVGGGVLILILAVTVFLYVRRKRNIASTMALASPTPGFTVNTYPTPNGRGHVLHDEPIWPNDSTLGYSQGIHAGYRTGEVNVYSGIEHPVMVRTQALPPMQTTDTVRPLSQTSAWAGGLDASPAAGPVYIPPGNMHQRQQWYVGEIIHPPSVYTDKTEGVSNDPLPSSIRHEGAVVGGPTPLLLSARSLERKKEYSEPQMTDVLDPSVYTGLHEKATYRGPLPMQEGYNGAGIIRQASRGASPPSY